MCRMELLQWYRSGTAVVPLDTDGPSASRQSDSAAREKPLEEVWDTNSGRMSTVCGSFTYFKSSNVFFLMCVFIFTSCLDGKI